MRSLRATVIDIHDDGSLIATGHCGTVRLPASYVAEHVDLAYATTGVGAQGRTVDAGLLFLDTGEEQAADVFARSIVTDWIDLRAHTRRAEPQVEWHRSDPLDGRSPAMRDLEASEVDGLGIDL
jgi:hypothetical protein